MKSNHKAGKVIEIIKNILCVVLFVSMVTSAAVYMLGTQKKNIRGNESSYVDRNAILTLLNSNDTNTNGSNFCRIYPSFVGYKINGKTFGILSDSEIMRGIYGMIAGGLSSSLGEGSTAEIMSRSVGDEKWNAIIESDTYIYIKYPSEMPREIVCPDFADGGKMSDDNVSFSIKEIFVDYDSNGAPTVYARSGSGVVAKFSAKKSLSSSDFDISYIAAYYDTKDFLSFSFASDARDFEINGGIEIGNPIIMIDGDITLPGIKYVPKSLYPDADESQRNAIVTAFGFDMNITSGYSADGSFGYVGETGTVSIETSRVRYSSLSSGSGIDIEKINGHPSNSSTPAMNEILRASTSILYDLALATETDVESGTDISLYSLSYAGGELSINFAYRHDGVCILDTSGNVMLAGKVTVRSDKIVAFEFFPACFERDGASGIAMSQKWALQKTAALVGEIKVKDLILAYVCDSDSDEYCDITWVAVEEEVAS